MTPTLFDAFPEAATSARPSGLAAAVDAYADAQDDARGAVYTRPEVVRAILDLAGYTSDRPLHTLRLLEPSAGGGEFVEEVVRRLLASMRAHVGTLDGAAQQLSGALCAVELSASAARATRLRLAAVLAEHDVPAGDADALLEAWIVRDDFLLRVIADASFDFVVGNPPYVRQERIPAPLLAAYRARYETLYDRADLYVPFVERGIALLKPGGRLAFVCSDRWTKNRYGGPLRALVARTCALEHYLDLTGVQAFDREVVAYPSVFVLRRLGPGDAAGDVTAVGDSAHRPVESLPDLARAMRRARDVSTVTEGDGAHVPASVDTPSPKRPVRLVAGAVAGSAPWLMDSGDVLALARHLEATLPTLEETGCRVGIGVASGLDRVYVRLQADLPVEPERMLPLVMAGDLHEAALRWGGRVVLNPFEEDGSLAPLDAFPRFAVYLRAHEAPIRARQVARRSPGDRWYRTIDRITPSLAARPKLLIPDIKGAATVAYDDGAFYPHHNLYHITTSSADGWDLRALQAVLRSRVGEFFVALYCVKMQGGFRRFQAQYVRRVRLPDWADVAAADRAALVSAAMAPRDDCDRAAAALYGLSADEMIRITAYLDASRTR